MDKLFTKMKRHARRMVQVGFALLTNGNLAGFLRGRPYAGQTKHVCVPGLDCYSCPGALGACPIGAMQAVEGAPGFRFSCYVLGTVAVFGALLGRYVCGWLCPFGLVQDLFHKIPFPKKLKKLPGDRWLKYGKYAALLILVLLLPAVITGTTGIGDPWFCKYVCPSGTLLGAVPLMLANPALARAAGGLFAWKLAVLLVVLFLSVLVWRPFCRYLCPLGALYGLLNPVAALGFAVDATKCTRCGACRRACKLDIPTWQKPNSMECVRCGACKRACPHGAIETRCFGRTLRMGKKREPMAK